MYITTFANQANKSLEEIIKHAKILGFSLTETSLLTIRQIEMLCNSMKINIDSIDSKIRQQGSKIALNTEIKMQKDRIFLQDSMQSIPKFEFNAVVASVFDDMLWRSIPFYDEVMNLAIFFIHQYIKESEYVQENSYIQRYEDIKENKKCLQTPVIYDIGSSTGNLLLKLAVSLQQQNIKAHLYGIDNAEAMIELARRKSEAMGFNIEFLQLDFLTADFKPANVFLAFYTMQFVRPLQRQNMIQKIYNALCSNGIFLFAEKVISQDSKLEGQMISCYYDYKGKQGYTHTEIYKKREALENVLVPYSVEENYEMLRSVGFTHIEILFKWVNFTLFLARK